MDQYIVSACVLSFPHRVMIQQVLGCAGHSTCWGYILMCRYGIPKFIGAVMQNTTSRLVRSGASGWVEADWLSSQRVFMAVHISSKLVISLLCSLNYQNPYLVHSCCFVVRNHSSVCLVFGRNKCYVLQLFVVFGSKKCCIL